MVASSQEGKEETIRLLEAWAVMSQSLTPAVRASHRAISDSSQASSSSSETRGIYTGLDFLSSLSKEAPFAANGLTRNIRLCVACGLQCVFGGDAQWCPFAPFTMYTHLLMFWADLWPKLGFSNPLPPSFFLSFCLHWCLLQCVCYSLVVVFGLSLVVMHTSSSGMQDI